MSNELTEKEKQELEEEKAIAWLRGQKIAKANFNETAFKTIQQKAQTEAQAEINRNDNEEFARNLRKTNRRIQSESKKEKNSKTES